MGCCTFWGEGEGRNFATFFLSFFLKPTFLEIHGPAFMPITSLVFRHVHSGPIQTPPDAGARSNFWRQSVYQGLFLILKARKIWNVLPAAAQQLFSLLFVKRAKEKVRRCEESPNQG